MKKISSVWFALSVFVFPCVFNLERIGICVILLANIIVSFRWFKKHNPEYVL